MTQRNSEEIQREINNTIAQDTQRLAIIRARSQEAIQSGDLELVRRVHDDAIQETSRMKRWSWRCVLLITGFTPAVLAGAGVACIHALERYNENITDCEKWLNKKFSFAIALSQTASKVGNRVVGLLGAEGKTTEALNKGVATLIRTISNTLYGTTEFVEDLAKGIEEGRIQVSDPIKQMCAMINYFTIENFIGSNIDKIILFLCALALCYWAMRALNWYNALSEVRQIANTTRNEIDRLSQSATPVPRLAPYTQRPGAPSPLPSEHEMQTVRREYSQARSATPRRRTPERTVENAPPAQADEPPVEPPKPKRARGQPKIR